MYNSNYGTSGRIPMNDYKLLSKIICDQFETDHPVVLVSIISMEGSTPRESGTKMVVGADGRTYGTVGGSLIEATAITGARKVLDDRHPILMDFNLTGSSTASPGMICGGKAVLLLDFVIPSVENKNLFKQMKSSISEGSKFHLITCFKELGSTIEVEGHCLLFPDGTVKGDYILGTQEIQLVREALHDISSTTVFPIADRKFIIDPVSRFKTLYCFGAGHVALPTAHVASMVGFKVVVIDDRDEYANASRFPEAGQILVISDFQHAIDDLDIDEDSYIVIVTRGHMYDRIVLEQALKTNAGYIGMISSRTKRDAIYKTLITEGIASEKDLERVYSPIGLPIGGETPEEIAVSIVAELISVRAKQKK
jgi:xanthine dehydrogenase accessory factor